MAPKSYPDDTHDHLVGALYNSNANYFWKELVPADVHNSSLAPVKRKYLLPRYYIKDWSLTGREMDTWTQLKAGAEKLSFEQD